MKAIKNNELEHLLKFIGYGPKNSNYWFLGMEEGGGDENNIKSRLKFKQFEDCANAHIILGITKFHSGKKIIQRTWRGMSILMLLFNNKKATLDNVRDYQSEKLGRLTGDTLLCELMPLPKPSISTWHYKKLIPQYKSRNDYYEKVLTMRIKLLRKHYINSKPKIIIAYGKSFWKYYKMIFSGVNFKKIGQIEIGKKNNTTIILIHHFTARTMNGKLNEVASLMNINA